MTRKDFVSLAAAVALIEDRHARLAVSLLIGRVCERTNPRFSWSKWEAVTLASLDAEIDAAVARTEARRGETYNPKGR